MTKTESNEPAKKVDPYLLRLRLESRLKLNIITPEERRQLQDLKDGSGQIEGVSELNFPFHIQETGISVPEQDKTTGLKPPTPLTKRPSAQVTILFRHL